MLAFGYAEWSRRGEFLSVFFTMVSRFAVVERDRDRPAETVLAGRETAGDAEPLPLSGAAFLLLALSSVSFDGLSKTFFWLGLHRHQPARISRAAPRCIGTARSGLVLTFVLLAAVFLLAVVLGERLAGSTHPLRVAAGLLVWSIVPIALAYHFAHYLTSLLVDGQYALVALSDPFSLGWNLFGTADMQVEAGIVAGAGQAWLLWNLQAGGHHRRPCASPSSSRTDLPGGCIRRRPGPMLSQLPLTLLMIGYTVFGLWLLATPSI